MSVPFRHVLQQGPNLKALAKAATSGLRKGKGTRPDGPGEVFEETIQPPPRALVADYIDHVGGDAQAYAGRVPHHLFPQWGFHIMSKTLDGLPFDLSKALNGGVHLTMNAPLPGDRPWKVTAQLSAFEESDSKVLMTQRLTTGPVDAPEALVAETKVLIPKKRKGGSGKKKKKEPVVVPADAALVGTWDLPGGAGYDFAVLTGDFNPIHWIPAYARLSGFKGCINHGYSTFARSIETLIAERFGGNVDALATVEGRFARPVPLPGTVSVFTTDSQGLFVGPAAGDPAALIGSYTPSEA